jgi:hypothetical protein
VLFRLQILILLIWVHPRSTTQPLKRLHHHLWISAIVRPWGRVVRAGRGCSSIARRERVVSWSTGTLSLVTKVMKARHPRCSRFMLCRITSSFAEYSPLLSSLLFARSFSQSVSVGKNRQAPNPLFSLSLSLSLKQQGEKSLPPSLCRSNSPNSTPFDNLASFSCGWIDNLEDWNQTRKLSLSD